MKKKDELIVFKKNSAWAIYPDPKAESISPRWWHKLLFWKKWNYQQWIIRREYKSLKEMMEEV